MFGRHPRLPIDVFLGLEARDEKSTSTPKYVSGLRERLNYAYNLASERNAKAGAKNKVAYDKKLHENKVNGGDRVLVKNLGIKGKNKLGDKWGKNPYIVVEQPNVDLPVYKVRPEVGGGKSRTLHRNLLLPCNFLPRYTPPQPNIGKRRSSTPKPRADSDTVDIDVCEEDVEEDCVNAWNVPILPSEERNSSDVGPRSPDVELRDVPPVDEVHVENIPPSPIQATSTVRNPWVCDFFCNATCILKSATQ